ncbi:hypothetical protein [Paenibacillus endoradicis]|uniref:hypothetical protein n=1 Tax=Paenibacillus endoradicis TaxID=2972487 RepID=UPI0021598AC0|nr:hypothetical protein [Paenibacillus endoradicis]MCR8656233.1 hypothetical protein [Paenibacillus endoradicis]
MKVKLKQEDLQNIQLSWKCIEPMLLAVRGKDFPTKIEMYQKLNEGQKGLYLFYSFHNHANTMAEFYWFSSYYINEVQSWSGIKSGVQYYMDDEMVDLLEQIELIIQQRNQENITERKASPTDLETDEELYNKVKVQFDRYRVLSENTIDLMNQWIINNKKDFIDIDSH